MKRVFLRTFFTDSREYVRKSMTSLRMRATKSPTLLLMPSMPARTGTSGLVSPRVPPRHHSTPGSREHMMKERYHSGMLKYSRLTSITLMAKTSLKAAIGYSVRLCSMALTFLRRIFIFRTAVFPRIKSAITAQSMTRRSGAWIFSL